MASEAMSATADCDEEIVTTGEVNRPLDVSGVCASHDQSGTPIEGAVPAPAGRFVRRIIGTDELAGEVLGKSLN